VLFGVGAAAALTLVALIGMPQLGAWDAISAGALAAGGALLGAAADRRAASALLASTAAALVGLEAATRLLLPPPPLFPSPADARLLFAPAAWDAGCAVLYEAADVDDDVHVLRPPPRYIKTREHAPLIVHLGDSMTYGEGVRAEEAFPALLDARQPAVTHRNYGVWAVGTDFQFLLFERILEAHSPAMVVLHVYPANDIYDIDRPYACCDAGPLLEYGPDGLTARCTAARWRLPLGFRLSRSPPPYPLRVAAHWSYAARHAAASIPRLVLPFEPRTDFIRAAGEASETGWEHFAQILAKLHDEMPPNAELILNLLPDRHALEADNPAVTTAYRAGRRVVTIAEKIGIRTIDAWDVFAAAVKRDGAARYFRDENDIHLTPAGHRLLADWLEKQLGLG
jgi:lysophospholipase L1-like esterase